MKCRSSGFTLIETVMATGILVIASAAIASLFVSSLRTNINNQDRTTASLLLSDTLEQFTALPLSDARWTPGSYFEFISVASDGSATVSQNDASLKFLRTWQISGTQPPVLTVIIYTNRSAITGRQTELIRANVAQAARW